MSKQISRAGRFRMFHCLKSKPSFIHLVKVQTGNMESITAVKKREIDKKTKYNCIYYLNSFMLEP